MDISNRKEPVFLFAGDLISFYVSLWLMLFLRYGELPGGETWDLHFLPFSILFSAWVLVFFIAGLYEKHTTLFKSRLPSAILNTLLINSAVAVLFFYFVPQFGITPKTNLFLYLVISFALVVGWRLYGPGILGFRRRERAILIGAGREMRELKEEVNGNARYNLTFTASIDLDRIEGIDSKRDVFDRVSREGISVVVIDIKNEKIEPILPHLYDLIFHNVRFVGFHKVYEEIFDRVPLSLVGYNWFLENISLSSHAVYNVLKRVMDVTIAFTLGVISLVLYPIVLFLVKLDDGGPIFIVQERIGKGNKIIKLVKFRSMKRSDSGVWLTEDDSRVTRAGKFLRKTRIDELPQLWNVVRGDLSLIGPRPDIIGLGQTLAKEIPYYTVRNLIAPGLSGWAQIKQELPPQSVEETKLRLSYDLYYTKNRSFLLDIVIALKTIKTLLSRTGM